MDSHTLVLVCNLIPAFIVLFFPVRGWVRGGLYMLVAFVRLIGSFYITKYLSNYLANFLLEYPTVRNQIISFVLSNEKSLNQLPGASLFMAGRIIDNNIESIAWWILYFLCFIIVFILVLLIFTFLLRLAINFNKIPVLGFVNKLFGSAIGLFIGLFITLLLIYTISFIANLIGDGGISQYLMASWLPVLFRTYF